MAIIIPSKNIYEISNPKVRDNVIDNISVEQTIIKPNNEFGVTIFSEKISNGFVKNERISKSSKLPDTQTGEAHYAYADLQTSYIKNYHISIPKLLTNKRIVNAYDKTNDNGEPNIKHTVYYLKTEYSLTADIVCVINQPLSITNIQRVAMISQENGSGQIPPPENEVGVPNFSSNTAIAQEVDETNLSTLDISGKNESSNEFGLDVTILSGVSFREFSGRTNNLFITNKETLYEPNRIEITIYGDTIGIDLTDGSVTYGSGNKPHSLSGNELMQDSAKVNGVALTEHLANNVLSQYAKGKETATLLCSISDYYDEENAQKIIANNFQIIGENDYDYWVDNLPIGENDDGIMEYNHIAIIQLNKPATTNILFSIGGVYVGISIGETMTTYSYIDDNSETPDFLEEIEIIRQEPKMTFEIGENVIPMVFSANGKDQPMSKNQDGSAKVFEIIGINFIYDGAVWQELSLLEKLK